MRINEKFWWALVDVGLTALFVWWMVCYYLPLETE